MARADRDRKDFTPTEDEIILGFRELRKAFHARGIESYRMADSEMVFAMLLKMADDLWDVSEDSKRWRDYFLTAKAREFLLMAYASCLFSWDKDYAAALEKESFL